MRQTRSCLLTPTAAAQAFADQGLTADTVRTWARNHRLTNYGTPTRGLYEYDQLAQCINRARPLGIDTGITGTTWFDDLADCA